MSVCVCELIITVLSPCLWVLVTPSSFGKITETMVPSFTPPYSPSLILTVFNLHSPSYISEEEYAFYIMLLSERVWEILVLALGGGGYGWL